MSIPLKELIERHAGGVRGQEEGEGGEGQGEGGERERRGEEWEG